jgi:hypothetical protein
VGRRVTDVLDGDIGFQARHADTSPTDPIAARRMLLFR